MAEQPAARAPVLPLFYQQPVALQAERHRTLSLRRPATYEFAHAANAIPLTAPEFLHAQRDYPIVFTEGPQPMPMAVVGVREASNLFVEADGNWRKGAYVPAYLRRYPFLLAHQATAPELVLGIDEASPLLVRGGDNPLFRDGKPSGAARKALEFALAYERQLELTREFVRALQQVEFLAGREARMQVAPGETLRLRGFQMIDEARFNELPVEAFREWRAKGWIALVYAHLLSLGAWERLVQLAGERAVEAGR